MPVQCTCQRVACGAAFIQKPGTAGLYCSVACSAEMRRTLVEVACEACGTPFMARPSHRARGHDRWCSRLCSDARDQRFSEARFWVAFWEKTRPEGDCLIWTGKQRWSRHGDYGLVWVGAGATPKYRGPHQVVLEKKLGRPLAPGLQVNHTCDHMRCVAEDHLYEGTQQQNIADMHARGRATKARGSRDGNAKLTEAQVYEIKLALVRGERQYVLAARYGVSFQLISEIARGKIWNHIILAS